MHISETRRKNRFSGIASLMQLAIGALGFGTAEPRIPSSSRLRRDIGLPEIEDLAATPTLPQRRI